MPETVDVDVRCPSCGAETTWRGVVVTAGGGTKYETDCGQCPPVEAET